MLASAVQGTAQTKKSVVIVARMELILSRDCYKDLAS